MRYSLGKRLETNLRMTEQSKDGEEQDNLTSALSNLIIMTPASED